MSLTLTDMFCGAGGSSTGAIANPAVTVRMAANHWDLAVETHNTNHPDADHVCADLSATDPRYFPTTDLLWASPECTNHSQAKGRKRPTPGQADLFGDTLPDEAAERSRATMWDVVRFSERHRYRAVIVENVVDAWHWEPFRAWLLAMDSLGYDHQLVFLNSMHAQAGGLPAPQSRDRMYVVFHRKGDRRPDVHAYQRPRAWCPSCDRAVGAVQSWKRLDRQHGRYRQQYLYRCPTAGCHAVVEPGWLPAAAAIDWSLPGTRIGDRAKPLAAKTRARIAAGIARYWRPVHLEAAGHTYDAADPKHPQHGDPGAYYRAWPVDEVFKTLHTIESKALAVPVEGRDGKQAQPAGAPLRTQTTRLETALVTPYYGHSTPTTTDEALPTVTTVDRHALVMRNNTARGDQGQMSTPIVEPLRTITTAGHQSLLSPGDMDAAAAMVDDVLFRMLEPSEVIAAMAFPDTYVVLGNRRERVRMAGNAVTPPAARDLVAAVVESLGAA